MSEFVQGQRWVVDSEPELGLGTVVSVEGRRVNIFFEQGDCERTYAIKDAPLTRITYAVEDTITTREGVEAQVKAVHEHNGLIFYEAESGDLIPETSLSTEIQLNHPFMRLMTGQLDNPKWFAFKRQLSKAISDVWRSRLNGLLGVRANLIPHQLYVAWSACDRENVRVLLADEVGLGKTIEAGMILSRLIKLERISRALIVVPDALQVQWLIELVRRFAIKAELYQSAEHDFHSGQIHLIPHSAFSTQGDALVAGEFDIVVLDEAHHITPNSEEFAVLKQLSQQTKHMVLLTATPEQLGVESHFARLQLLDEHKFSAIDQFIEQERKYVQLNEDIKNLPQSRAKVIADYGLDITADDDDDALISQLLDSHGVGRVVFRNVRSAVKGFPQRLAQLHELTEDSWEAKYEWLATWLKEHGDEKVLVICHDIEQVFACESYLWKKHGLDAAVFHEEQNLIERDKAAAYFSDLEFGAQILICSEIGSEGRNFQFSAHLVCMDLPTHPDLLEQRIGRLDRIGQTRDVNIHIPFSKDSDTYTRLSWYHEVLDCIEQQNPAAGSIHDKFWPQLDGSLDNAALVTEAKAALAQLTEEIQQGRDGLLEMNSCRQPFADSIGTTISEFEENTPHALVEMASELLHFHFEETTEGAFSVIPSDKMLIPSLPGIPPEGTEITFQREVASHREDLLFVSWDAPLIQGLWELLHYSELGSASVATLPSRQLPTGHCLLETCFDVVVQSEHASECRAFLETMTVRALALDVGEKDLSAALPEDALENSLQSVKKHLARNIITSQKDNIPTWFKRCEDFAEQQKVSVLESAIKNANQHFEGEIQRLKRLAKHNDMMGQEDVDQLQEQADSIVKALKENAGLHLSSIRLIVITDSQ